MEHSEWLMHRKNAVGGSDASTVVGLNPYSSVYELWADKLGRIPPKEENEAMRIGHDLEEYVAKRFTEATGKRFANGAVKWLGQVIAEMENIK